MPRFTIAIPTRNRHETLGQCIQTCLAQSFGDFEIVVSDNCSTAETRAIVESFGSPKIKYIRSDASLAMSDNWELALSQATGEYIAVVGDDDGLLLHALSVADRLIRELQVEVLYSPSVVYAWPNLEGTGIQENCQVRQNSLLIPWFGGARVLRSEQALFEAIDCLPNAMRLPSFYNSFVHRRLVAEFRAKSGRVFSGMAPDVYSGFAIAAHVDRFGNSGLPLRISGISRKSNGHAQLDGLRNSIYSEFVQLNERSGLGWSRAIPDVPKSFSAIAAECLQQVRDNLFANDHRLTVPRKVLVTAIMADLRQTFYPLEIDEWRRYIEEIKRYVSVDLSTTKWFEETFKDAHAGSPPNWTQPSPRPLGLFSNGLHIDVSHLGVHGVFDAAKLLDGMMFAKYMTRTELEAGPILRRWVSATKAVIRDLGFVPMPVRNAIRNVGRRGKPNGRSVMSHAVSS